MPDPERDPASKDGTGVDTNLRLLVATRSAHKLKEIRKILAPATGVEVVGLREIGIPWSEEEEGLEPHDTFRENAASKARYFHRLSGLPTVADDSGLAVDALEGRPGVRSKRFAPDEGLDGEARDRANNRHLVELLEGVPREERTARYLCVAALVTDGARSDAPRSPGSAGATTGSTRGSGGGRHDPDRATSDDPNRPEPTEEIVFFRGEAPGLIVDEARGSGGFGYDPHFFDPELGKTFAQISAQEKNARSHRGKAFRALAEFLASGGTSDG